MKVADSMTGKFTAKVAQAYVAAGNAATVTMTKSDTPFTSDRTVKAYASDGTTLLSTNTATKATPASTTLTYKYNMTAQDTILVVS